MGTPHRGSKVADFGHIIASVIRCLGLPNKILKALKSNSSYLRDVTDNFVRIASRYEIKSFYEAKKTARTIAVSAPRLALGSYSTL